MCGCGHDQGQHVSIFQSYTERTAKPCEICRCMEYEPEAGRGGSANE